MLPYHPWLVALLFSPRHRPPFLSSSVKKCGLDPPLSSCAQNLVHFVRSLELRDCKQRDELVLGWRTNNKQQTTLPQNLNPQGHNTTSCPVERAVLANLQQYPSPASSHLLESFPTMENLTVTYLLVDLSAMGCTSPYLS